MFTYSVLFTRRAAARSVAGAALAGALLVGTALLATPGAAAQLDLPPDFSRADVDNDRLASLLELDIGTDWRNPDSDRDGLLDGDEYWDYGTNPLSSDTDGDMLGDRGEILLGTDPLVHEGAVPAPAPAPAPAPDLCAAPGQGVDSDGDGMFDADECGYFNTNPSNPDTDGDGAIDGLEDENGTNPNDPNDF